MEDLETETEYSSSPPLQDTCIQEVTALFPDICLEYLQSIAGPLSFVSYEVINHLLDLQDSGQQYQKATRPKQTIGKRKRAAEGQDDEDADKELQERLSEAKRKYNNPDGPVLASKSVQVATIRQMIAGDFPLVPLKVIQQILSENRNHLFPTFTAIDAAINRADDDHQLPWKFKKTPSIQKPRYRKERIDASIQSCPNDWEKELMKELEAARLFQWNVAEQSRVAALAEEAERINLETADAKGEVTESDHPHPFCINCARRHAETQIGLSKYELECMSMNGCTAGFSYTERQKFLDKNLTAAIDRIEQEANLRLAELPDLAKCPFCHYAEEYPPVTVNREFRCRNDDCKIISCRLCNFETHIPKTCQESALERGVDLRREVEEAMSRALIRDTPFIKEEGCNKMTCTRQGCGNVQCYVCSKSCDYDHFNDERRGGKQGNCPLFESAEERHENEVSEAEKAARKKVLEENPELASAPEFLDFNMSEKVMKDDMRRKNRLGQRYRVMDMAPPGRAAQMPRQHNPDILPYEPQPRLEQGPGLFQLHLHVGQQQQQQADDVMLRHARAQAQIVYAQQLAQANQNAAERVAEAQIAMNMNPLPGMQIQAQQQAEMGLRRRLKNAVAARFGNRGQEAQQAQQLPGLPMQAAQAAGVPVAPGIQEIPGFMERFDYLLGHRNPMLNWHGQGQGQGQQ
ncbi:RING finger (TRIAD) [Fusarium beomiforme]|uniref:RING finger (TRIAD) n=1 Tax=Fusarium beomiforme TaxID=44412 RepID=A0A9P5DSL9_9HYPO|nr:RING finger (TRIAD) [Fusarium beomiforme]